MPRMNHGKRTRLLICLVAMSAMLGVFSPARSQDAIGRYPLFDQPANIARKSEPVPPVNRLPIIEQESAIPQVVPARPIVEPKTQRPSELSFRQEELPPATRPVPLPVAPQPPALPASPPPAPSATGPATAMECCDAPDHHEPDIACGAHHLPYFREDFGGDPICYELPYDPYGELQVYEGKQFVPAQRPWLELGRPFYDWGQFPPSSTIFGPTNLAASQFLLFGDFRTAIAMNDNGAKETSQIAARLNLELDWKITSTERFHGSFQPMNRGNNFTRIEFIGDDTGLISNLNANPFTGFFEGDLGAMWGGLTGQVMPFDLPVAAGFMPLVFQNGIWLEDNSIGLAATIPARNSRLLDISNYDITFFYLFDNVNSAAFGVDDNAARVYGVAGFFEMLDGYIEADYAYLEDRSDLNRSYHNLGLAYTRRYFSFLSNSIRMITNLGQDPDGIANTADGTVFLWENSIITENPYFFVPYFNLFAGFDRPQSVARNGAAGGILRNTGILFETDNLTGFPTLDPIAHDTYGGAFGLNIIPKTIDRQLVVEYAYVGAMNNALLPGNQHGVGLRYQKNLSFNWLLRSDVMYGWRGGLDDVSGARVELRYKF